MVGASNKPFDYLGCGLALITNATPEWREFFGNRGVSVFCIPESISSIAKAITWLHDHPEERAAMGLRGRKLIENEWNYEFQFSYALNLFGVRREKPAMLEWKRDV